MWMRLNDALEALSKINKDHAVESEFHVWCDYFIAYSTSNIRADMAADGLNVTTQSFYVPMYPSKLH